MVDRPWARTSPKVYPSYFVYKELHEGHAYLNGGTNTYDQQGEDLPAWTRHLHCAAVYKLEDAVALALLLDAKILLFQPMDVEPASQ